MLFNNRLDAGKQLASHLKHFESDHPLVLLIPRGGIEIGFQSIIDYHFDWDLMIPRKIGAPHNKEVAIGAVTMDGNYLLYEEYIQHLQVSDAYIQTQIEQEMIEIKRRMMAYRQEETFPSIKNRTVILIDDGIATGFTLLAAIKSIHTHEPKKLIVAVPVAPTETIEAFRQFADEIICLHSVDHFTSVGAYYQEFPQITDKQVHHYIKLLKQKKIVM